MNNPRLKRWVVLLIFLGIDLVFAGYRWWWNRQFDTPEAAAPGSAADVLVRDATERVRVRQPGSPLKADYGKQVPVIGYTRMVEELRAGLGMTCKDSAQPQADIPEMVCSKMSFNGQAQAIVIRLSSDDGAPVRFDAVAGDKSASVALAAMPDRDDAERDRVIARAPGKPFAVFLVGPQPETREFADKFAGRYALLDESSKKRVLRAIARQLDERFEADPDDAMRPVLQQLDYGALFVRRVGDARGVREIARAAGIKTYASFAIAECDRLAPEEARACFLQYVEARPELRAMLGEAVAQVRSANPSLDARHPVARRLALLAAFDAQQ